VGPRLGIRRGAFIDENGGGGPVSGYGEIVMQGFGDTRPAAKYQANRALFLLPSSASIGPAEKSPKPS